MTKKLSTILLTAIMCVCLAAGISHAIFNANTSVAETIGVGYEAVEDAFTKETFDTTAKTYDDFSAETENFTKGYRGFKVQDGKFVPIGEWASTYYNKELEGDFVINFKAYVPAEGKEVRFSLFSGETESYGWTSPEGAAFNAVMTTSGTQKKITLKSINTYVSEALIDVTAENTYFFSVRYVSGRYSLAVNGKECFGNVTCATIPSKYFSVQTGDAGLLLDDFKVTALTPKYEFHDADGADKYYYSFVEGKGYTRKITSGWPGAHFYDREINEADGDFVISYGIHLGKAAASNLGFRAALFTDKFDFQASGGSTGAYGGLYFTITSSGLSGFGVNGPNVKMSADNSVDYRVDLLYLNGEFNLFISDEDGNTLFSETRMNQTTINRRSGYFGFTIVSNASHDNYLYGFSFKTLSENPEAFNDEDYAAAKKFKGSFTYAFASKDDVRIKAANAWGMAYYNELLSGDFEISYDLKISADVQSGSSVRMCLFGEVDEGGNLVNAIEKNAGAYYFYVSGKGIQFLGCNADNQNSDYSKGYIQSVRSEVIKKDGIEKTYHITIRYVSGAISLKVDDTVIMSNYKNEEAFYKTEGYFIMQNEFTTDEINNFRVTRLTEEDKLDISCALSENEVLLGYEIRGGMFDGIYNFAAADKIYAKAEEVTVTPVKAKFYMETGAFVRLGDQCGIRWTVYMDKAGYDAINMFEAEAATEFSATKNGVYQTAEKKVENGLTLSETQVKWNASIVNVLSENYALEMTGIGFVRITYADKSVAKKYAIGHDNARSFKGILTRAYDDVKTEADEIYTTEITHNGVTAYTYLNLAQYTFIAEKLAEINSTVLAKNDYLN